MDKDIVQLGSQLVPELSEHPCKSGNLNTMVRSLTPELGERHISLNVLGI